MPCVPKHFIWVFISTCQVVERLCNLKPIAMKDDGGAEFELEMSLKDPSHKIFLFKVRNSWLGSIHYIMHTVPYNCTHSIIFRLMIMIMMLIYE